ncbi:MAG: SDR family oxidoreductase [Planctomycetaceae bacterium]|nr:SDR family oxidoreductase [Planctomycetales bacterium]MCB9927764.1 SDR family oxidoreductase [Planctomycetaceae bacterium]
MRVLRGAKALITGAANGIGRAIALRLAQEGTDLFLVDVDIRGLSNVVTEASQRGDVSVIGHQCDISSPSQISQANLAMLDRWGELDILVNNAGVCFYGATLEMTDDQWQQLLAINLMAPVQFVRELAPVLLSRPESHILNVASMYGFIATNRCSAYHLSKFGIVGFSEALRAEYARRSLGVTALCPGFVSTDLFRSMPNVDSGRTRRTPPRWVCTTPERVADKAVRAIRRNSRIALVTPLAYAAYYTRRFAPGLLDTLYHVGRRSSHRIKVSEKTPLPLESRQRIA